MSLNPWALRAIGKRGIKRLPVGEPADSEKEIPNP
jgi:hypothetical protein